MSGKPETFAPSQLDAFHGQGFDLIPLNKPDDRRDGNSVGKAPMRSNWRIAAPMTVEEAKAHMKIGSGNVGVRLARNQLVVDVDPRNFAQGEDSLERLQNSLCVDFDSFPVVETGGGGRHFYMLKPVETEVVGQLREFPGVEFKTEGRQVVAPGSIHPDTRRVYRWDALSVSLSEISEAPGALLSAIAKPAVIESQAIAGARNPEVLGQLLALLEVSEFGDHDAWLKIMMACHHAHQAPDGRSS
jgi:Bifunctional DNA primase/polymerase, N-terminal